MNKAELVVRMTEHNDIASKAEASRIMEHMIDVMQEVLGSGEEINISGLGRFTVVTREGTTKITGAEVAYSTKGVKFKAAEPLKRAVN